MPRPVHAVNTTPSYLFRKVSDEAGPPTILYDEIDTVFGPKAKDNEDVRGMLNAGHRKGATAGRCVVRGNVVSTEELPAYCAVASGRSRRLARHADDPLGRCEDAPPLTLMNGSSRGGEGSTAQTRKSSATACVSGPTRPVTGSASTGPTCQRA
ncbi:MAG: hypothetical protein WKF76_00570 [Nocardioidaceae bacterium]